MVIIHKMTRPAVHALPGKRSGLVGAAGDFGGVHDRVASDERSIRIAAAIHREKLGEAARFLETIRGVGYRFVAET